LDDEERALIGLLLPIGRFGPYPQRLRDQFEGVIWRFRTGSRWREMPEEFGPWQSVYGAFARWRDAGVFAALMEAMIAEAARRGQTDVSAAGTRMDPQVLDALEKAAAGEKGQRRADKRPI
jgi:transposase